MSPSDAISALLACGWTMSQIADKVGTSQPTISRINAGADCRHSLGEALIALVPKPEDDILPASMRDQYGTADAR